MSATSLLKSVNFVHFFALHQKFNFCDLIFRHFHSFQVAELKRLNKIEKEYEIHARKIIKVPVTPHSLLLENQPLVHRSGQSSPKHGQNNNVTVANESLLAAAVNLSTEPSINDIILNTPIASNHYEDKTASTSEHLSAIDDPLLGDASNEYGGVDSRSRPHSISGQNIDFRDFSCSGSDCDISWIFLLICILVLCVAIPLIYVFYIAEQEEIHRHHDIINHTTHHSWMLPRHFCFLFLCFVFNLPVN